MKRQCPICKKLVEEEVFKTCRDANEWAMKIIKREHPNWIASDGSCYKCWEYYNKLGRQKNNDINF